MSASQKITRSNLEKGFGGENKMKKLLSIMALFVISLLTVSMVSATSEVSTLGDLKVGDVKVEVNDGFADFICENTGTAFSPEIEEKGFTGFHSESTKDVPSSGYAMLHFKRQLNKIRGNLVPRNIRDSEGNILGAQTVISIPLRATSS